jgi:regulator of ribonuclease activity A
MSFATSDLFDAHAEEVQVLELPLRGYGGLARFHGEVVTVKCHEDNSRVKELLASPGGGKVLVVDGGGSLRCALLGDLIATAALENGWRGVVIHGAVRDVSALAQLKLGVVALGSTPRKSVRRGAGQTGATITFGGVTFKPGCHVYVDADGLLVATRPLTSAS